MAKNRKTPDMNLPVWFDGQNINEALFCEEFLQERRIIFTNRAFFTPNGRVTDDIVLRGEVYEKLKSYTISSVPQKIKNIMELLKLEAMVDDFPPQPDRIHVANGTLMLDGRFIEEKKEIVQSRLPISYNPNAAAPALWLNFLDGLLYEEDIPTLQEFIGYCLIPSNKGQRMMVIKGNGGEGKSQIGAVLSAIFGTNMKDGSIGKVSIDRVSLSCKVYEGATDSSMSKGAGHYTSSGIYTGNIGLFGHNRGSHAYFAKLKNVKIGDIVEYKTAIGTKTYQVTFVGSISYTDYSYLNEMGDNRITLITCIANQPSLRLCVQAVEIR